MKAKTIFISLISVIVGLASIYGIYNYFENQNRISTPYSPEKLRYSIAMSLSNPFANADTVVIETLWGFCGNTPSSQWPVVFVTEVDKPTNILLISQNFDQTVLSMDSLRSMVDEIGKTNYSEPNFHHIWDSVAKTIVELTVNAEKISNTHIKTYERFDFKNETKTIHKDFKFLNNDWFYSISDSLSYTY